MTVTNKGMAQCSYREAAARDELLDQNYKKHLADAEPAYRDV